MEINVQPARPTDDRILIVGGNSRLAKTFLRKYPWIRALGREEADLLNLDSLLSAIRKHQPDIIINCAAYTNVDQAETEHELALSINAEGVANLANACKITGAKLCHFSTDYVFDGRNYSICNETDLPRPINWYGYSKLAGEILVQHYLNNALIIRFSFPFGQEFNSNFVSKVINYAQGWKASKTGELMTVCDQWIMPTWCDDLVEATLHLVNKGATGVVHFTNSGKAPSITTLAGEIAEMMSIEAPINNDYMKDPALGKAPRPRYSQLSVKKYENITGQRVPNWKISLGQYLSKLVI